MGLPRNVTQEQFDAAIGGFREAVGAEWVFTDEENLHLYRDAYSPLWNEEEERTVSAAVAPHTVEEVQAVVRVANEYRIPIYPIATGMNLGYGGSAPFLKDSVVLDLKRMNRILEVDADRGFAFVEPGVSYFQLYRYIEERNLDVWIDTPDPGWGSVMGNALDHGVGYTYNQYRDHFRSHCGLEVVLASGEVMRTGMGAMPGNEAWGEYQHGFGPNVDGLFAQGNAGIVTKMGIHLMPAPKAYRAGRVLVPRRQDLIPLVAMVNRLEHLGLIGRPLYGSPMNAQQAGSEELRNLVSAEGGWDDDLLDAWGVDNDVPHWQVELQFYGPERTCEANWEFAREEIAERIPGATFEEIVSYTFPLSPEDKHNARNRVALGIPNMQIFSIGARTATNPNPRDGHLWFAPIVPKSGEHILRAQRILNRAFVDLEMTPQYGPFSTPATWTWHAFVFITGLGIWRNDVEANQATRRVFEELVRVGAENGYGEYRSPPAFADLIASTYSFNNNIQLRFRETIKDAIDPNGILAAGRSGIWPRHLREG